MPASVRARYLEHTKNHSERKASSLKISSQAGRDGMNLNPPPLGMPLKIKATKEKKKKCFRTTFLLPVGIYSIAKYVFRTSPYLEIHFDNTLL